MDEDDIAKQFALGIVILCVIAISAVVIAIVDHIIHGSFRPSELYLIAGPILLIGTWILGFLADMFIERANQWTD